MIGIIIKYSKFYGRKIPVEPLELLSHLPKTEIIATISKMNSLLQPMGYRTIDDSRKTQIECLKTILLPDEKNAPIEYTLRFKEYERYFSELDDSICFFTRVSCIYAINEILQVDGFFKGDKSQYTFDERKPLLDYLLICNERILEFSENSTLEQIRENKIDFFEFNAFNQVPHNQYYLNVNLLTKLYKSRYFFNVLLSNEETAAHFQNYFSDKFNISDVAEFFKIFFWSFMKMGDEKLKMYYLNIPRDEKGALNIIRGFSASSGINSINHEDIRTLDLRSIKKNPVYEWEPIATDDFIGFLILDQKFLLEKIDSLLINDFWFDYLKSHSALNRQDWGNFIGSKFFEPFVAEIFENTLEENINYSLKLFDDLKLKFKGNQEIEVADVYVRYKQQILLAEVKSNYINMLDGYKSITSIEDFKNLKLEKFYSSFGLTQLAKKTLKEFHNYKNSLRDEGLNLRRKVHLFPVIIVNEPILSSGLFHFPLRTKFENILKEENIQLKCKEHLIWPLLIINIEELQEMEQSIKEGSVDLFSLLKMFHDKTRIGPNDKRKKHNYSELLSMTNIIDQKVEPEKLFPQRLKDYRWVVPDE